MSLLDLGIYLGSTCMFNVVKKEKGKAESGFREWAFSSSEEACFRRDCTGEPKTLLCFHQDAVVAGRRSCGRIGKPISSLRLDLAQEQCAPVLYLVKLEPLNEP